MHPKIQIDTDFLLRQVAGLARVSAYLETWDEFGERVEARNEQTRPQIRRPRTRRARAACDAKRTEEAPRTYNWRRAKELLYALFTGSDPEHDSIRKRIQSLYQPSAQSLLPLLSLWLAGILEISIKVTRQMVAAILYAVSEMGGDWRIIRRSLNRGLEAGELPSSAHS